MATIVGESETGLKEETNDPRLVQKLHGTAGTPEGTVTPT
jgi:hypothetical protein